MNSRAERRRRSKIFRREQVRSERATRRRGAKLCEVPTIRVSGARFSISERTRAIPSGGIGVIHEMVRKLGLAESLNKNLGLLKRHLPYFESDHILTMAYNLLMGGSCLEDVERMRSDATLLQALGADRLPGATTLGDFTRRFETEDDVAQLMDVCNEIRRKVWAQQGEEFFQKATIDIDGTILPVEGNCKEGVGATYKGVIGYHPLLVSLAQTDDPLFIVNRPGQANSCLDAAEWLDAAIHCCRSAGFKSITLRGDTAFSQSGELDRWTDDEVRCLFGYQVSPALLQKAEGLPKRAWKKLERREKYAVATIPRGRRENHRLQVVEERGYVQLKLRGESYAEFAHKPTKADRHYRVIMLHKDIEKTQGPLPLLHEDRYFAYITNDWDTPADELIFEANERCKQEKLIDTLKNDVPALRAPVDNLVSNWAYMVIASLAWSLKVWLALLLPEEGRWAAKYRSEKRDALRMEFKRFLNTFVKIPAQIVRAARGLEYRFLGWTSGVPALFRVLDRLHRPLRC